MKFWPKNKEKIEEQHIDEKIWANDEGQEVNTHRFFDKIAFLRMTDQRKADIAEEILEDTYSTRLYWLELILSSVVATLGLLTNSIPVIIGAMLIAPILEPIKSFSFAVTTGNRHIYLRALKMMWLSVLVAIASAYLVTMIVPFADITSEILARTSPTLVDLIIALASGIIAIMSLGFKKLSQSIAWVAMAVALMPPLCVVGIGLQFVQWDITFGSSLLLLTNLIAIIVVGIIIFYAFGFFPTNKVGKKRSVTMTLLIILTIAALTIPLRKGMETIAFNFKTSKTINQNFENFREWVNQSIRYDTPQFTTLDEDTLRVSATLHVPGALKITDEHRQELTQRLAVATQKSIELQLNLIDISSVYIDNEEKLTLEEQLKDEFHHIIPNTSGLVLLDIKVAQNGKPLVLASIYNEHNVDTTQMEQRLEWATKAILGEEARLLYTWQRGKKIIQQDEEINTELMFFQDSVNVQFKKLFPTAELENLSVNYAESETWLIISLDFVSNQDPKVLENTLQRRDSIMEKYFQKEVFLKTKIQYYSKRDF